MSSLAVPAQNRLDPLPFQVALFCLLWSSAFAATKLALADCPPLLLLAARFLLTAALVLGTAAARGALRQLRRRDLLVFALLGIANNAVYLGLNGIGMLSVSSGLAALVASANPVLTALLAAGFLGEPMTWRKAAGLALGVAGIAFVVESRISSGTATVSGIACLIAALVSLVGGTILFKRLKPGGALWIGNGVQNLAGGLALAPFALTFERLGDVVPSWRLAAALTYLVLLVSAFGYFLWFHLLAVSGATAASAYHFLMPPLGMLFGWLILGEPAAVADLIGIIPVALGIWLVTRPAATPIRR